MKTISTLALVAALGLAACGPRDQSGSEPDLKSARARSKIIPAPPSGPVGEGVGTVVSTETVWVTLDHEGAAAAGLPAGRTRFRTWADVIEESPGEPGARVAFKAQRLGDGWAVVEMTGR